MKLLQKYHKPNSIWVQQTDKDLYITDIDDNDCVVEKLFDMIRTILRYEKNEWWGGGYNTIEEYRQKYGIQT